MWIQPDEYSALLVGFFAPVGQGGLTAELAWQVTLGRRLQSLFTDSLHQQGCLLYTSDAADDNRLV